jgi:hypothetical protein
MENMKVAENISNIGIMAGTLLSEKMIEVESSTELTQTIIELGDVFEEKFGKIVEETEDYLGYIDSFAQKELLKRYSTKELAFMEIYHTQNDKSMSGANFFLLNEKGIEAITDGNVATISQELLDSCNSILNEKGYEVVNSFIYYEDQVLTFEIKKVEFASNK